jgi:hypothetical protein
VKPKLVYVRIACLALLAIAACGDKVKDDLDLYVNEALPMAQRALHGTREQMSEIRDIGVMVNSAEDARFVEVERDVVARWSRCITSLEKIQPKTDEVRQVHASIVSVAKRYRDGLAEQAGAVERHDREGFLAAGRKADAAMEAYRATDLEIVRLEREHRVKLQPRVDQSVDEPASAAVTRDDCVRARDHIADLVLADYVSRPDKLWDDLHSPDAGGPPTDIPANVTKATFSQFLVSELGKTWVEHRRLQAHTGPDQSATASCVQQATRRWIDCSLAAHDMTEAAHCDHSAM